MRTVEDLCAYVLPPDDHLTFQSLLIDASRFLRVAAMLSTNATCPDCRPPTHRIPGHYRRTLADLPWATAPSELRVIVRRFRCPTCTCRRPTFAARLPSVAPLYARTTTRLATTQANTGLVLGGAAGSRHVSRHGAPVSRNTLLRRVRSVSVPEGPAPQIIGIDDWAWRKGNRYGTLIVDLQRGCPIDLLEDRAAETVATWLQAHPDVTIVARDRAEAYAAGIRQGAPEATQVADRFHLLKNLAAALQEVFNAHHRELDQLNHVPHHEPPTPDHDSVTVPTERPVAMTKAPQQIAPNRAKRVAEYAQAHALHQRSNNLVFLLNAPTKAQVVAAYRTAKSEISPSTPYVLFVTLKEQMDIALGSQRALSLMSNFFAGLALFLSGLGLYGLLSSSVAQRTSEIGVRMALGAERGRVLRMILSEGPGLLAGGLVLGALVLTVTIRSVRLRAHQARRYHGCPCPRRDRCRPVAGAARRIHRSHSGPARRVEALPAVKSVPIHRISAVVMHPTFCVINWKRSHDLSTPLLTCFPLK